MAKVIWNLHATTNRTASVDRTCAAGNITGQASIQGNEKPYMMWTLVGMVPTRELGFNLVVSVFAGEVAYGPRVLQVVDARGGRTWWTQDPQLKSSN